MIGGWVDARSGEAEEEVRNMFHAAGVPNTLDAISGPSGRTNFLRASILFPKEATLPQKRQLQKEVLDKLKNLKCSSGIEGQNGVTLWVQRDRSLEERLRIRALVPKISTLTFLRWQEGPTCPLPKSFGEARCLLGKPACSDAWMKDMSLQPLTRS